MKYLFSIISILTVSVAIASTPRFKVVDSRVEFERGKPENISILAEGKLAISPEKLLLMDTGDPYIWATVADSKGNLYLGTGNDGRVYKISATGDSSLFFDAKELLIYALTVDKNDNVYAGTSPEGCVYKISPNGDSAVFFDPEDLYIWALAFDSRQNLYVAAGEKALVYQVAPKGQHTIVLQTEQTHIRCLSIDSNDTVYAGSSGIGYVYRIIPGQPPFVLFDTQMEEVLGLACSTGGDVYAAVCGESQPQSTAPQEVKTSGGQEEQTTLPAEAIIIAGDISRAGQKVPSTLFLIQKNGYIKDLWQGKEERIQTLLMHSDTTVWVGTASDGKLYTVNRKGEISLLLKIEEPQIASMCRRNAQQVILSSANMGRCYQIGPRNSGKASFESEVIDTGSISTWGILSIEGENVANISFFSRSGNTKEPDQTWSEWSKITFKDHDGRITSPSARFFQWKGDFLAGKSEKYYLDKVTVSYIEKNFAPEIVDIAIHRPGDFFNPSQSQNPMQQKQEKAGLVFPQQLGEPEYKKGYRSIDWLFQDPNMDGIRFQLYYAQKNDRHWKKMTSRLESSVYSWDSAQMADGEYRIKIVASDSLANPPASSLKGEKISDVFVIDNSGPDIQRIQIQQDFKKLTFEISDRWNVIANVWYSLNASDWQIVYPVDGIHDSKKEQVEIILSKAMNEGDDFAVKADDAFGNVSVMHKIKGKE